MLLGCAATAGTLAWAGAATAAFTPRLTVSQASQNVGGAVTLKIGQPETDDSTAKISMFVPGGYTPTLDQTAGSSLGTFGGVVLVKSLGNARQAVNGAIRADNPATYTSDAQLAANATACTGTSSHSAVWTVSATLNNNPLDLPPVYVDPVTGPPESDLGALKLQWCLRSPDVLPPVGQTSGVQIVQASFTVKGVFKHPKVSGSFVFKSFVTPYVVGTGTANQGGTVESRAIVSLPVQLTLGARYDKKRRRLILSGSLTENGKGVGGAPIKLLAGRAARRMRALKTLRTSARGSYRSSVKVGRTTFFRTRATLLPRKLGSSRCTPSLPTVPCVTQTLAPFSVFAPGILKIVVRR